MWSSGAWEASVVVVEPQADISQKSWSDFVTIFAQSQVRRLEGGDRLFFLSEQDLERPLWMEGILTHRGEWVSLKKGILLREQSWEDLFLEGDPSE